MGQQLFLYWPETPILLPIMKGASLTECGNLLGLPEGWTLFRFNSNLWFMFLFFVFVFFLELPWEMHVITFQEVFSTINSNCVSCLLINRRNRLDLFPPSFRYSALPSSVTSRWNVLLFFAPLSIFLPLLYSSGPAAGYTNSFRAIYRTCRKSLLIWFIDALSHWLSLCSVCFHDSCRVILVSGRKHSSNLNLSLFASVSLHQQAHQLKTWGHNPLFPRPDLHKRLVLFLLVHVLQAFFFFSILIWFCSFCAANTSSRPAPGSLSCSVSVLRRRSFALLLSEAVERATAADLVRFMSQLSQRGPRNGTG